MASELEPVISSLLRSSLQPSSLPTYQRAWKLFHLFSHATFPGVLTGFPISPSILALFIAYMKNHHYAPSTVHTYVSALGSCHKLSGLAYPTKVFFVLQMLKGYGKLGSRLDSRLPVTLPILHRLLAATIHLCGSPYEICLFRAITPLHFLPALGSVKSPCPAPSAGAFGGSKSKGCGTELHFFGF